VVRILLAAGADPIAAWSSTNLGYRANMAATFDACIDALAPAQRTELAKMSKRWVSLRAATRSASKGKLLRRE